MRILYYCLVTVVAAAFLGMAAAVFLPPGGAPGEGTEARTDAQEPADEERVVVAAIPSETVSGVFSETDRSDLRPLPPSSLDYTPDATATATHMLIRGFRPRSYSIYDGGSGEVPRPTVVLFHGAGRTPLSMIDMWQEAADENGLMLIAIESATLRWMTNEAEAAVVLDMVADASERYRLNDDQVMLFGHSSGAIMAQYLANRIVGPWQAAAVHGGTFPQQTIRPRDSAVPIRHYLGGSDGIFASYDARLSGQALAEAGHDFDLALIPGHTHWLYEGGPAFAADAWEWFTDLTEAGS